MVKKKTLRLKKITLKKRKIKKSRKYYKGGFLPLLVAVLNITPELEYLIIDYFNSQKETLQQNYGIQTANQLLLRIRGYRTNTHDALYDDVNRKYEDYMTAQ